MDTRMVFHHQGGCQDQSVDPRNMWSVILWGQSVCIYSLRKLYTWFLTHSTVAPRFCQSVAPKIFHLRLGFQRRKPDCRISWRNKTLAAQILCRRWCPISLAKLVYESNNRLDSGLYHIVMLYHVISILNRCYREILDDVDFCHQGSAAFSPPRLDVQAHQTPVTSRSLIQLAGWWGAASCHNGSMIHMVDAPWHNWTWSKREVLIHGKIRSHHLKIPVSHP